MIDKNHRFNQIIEENFETDGINIGRTKNTEFAQELAHDDRWRRQLEVDRRIKPPEGGLDRAARAALAKKALEELAAPVFQNMSNVANGGEYTGWG